MPVGEHEGPIDFLSRLSFRNGRDNARYLCGDFGLSYAAILKCGPDTVETIAGLGSADGAALRAEAFVRRSTGSFFDHKGQTLLRGDLNRERLRICPACIEEDLDRWTFRPEARVSRRSWWCLLSLRTCPRHGLSLVDTIERDPSQDTSRSLAKVIPRLAKLRASTVERRPSTFESYVLARLAGTAQPHWLDRFPLYAVIQLCSHIGAVAVRGVDVSHNELSEDERWECAAAACEITSGGDAGVRALLDRLQSTFLKGKRSWGAHTVLGPLYLAFHHTNADPAYDPFRELVREHLFDTMPFGPADEVFGKSPAARRVHSLKTASIELDMSPTQLRKLLTESGVVDIAGADVTPDRLTFLANALEPIKAELADTLKLDEALRYLRLPHNCKYEWNSPWFPKPWFNAGTARMARPIYRRRDLDVFVDNLKGRADPGLMGDATLVDIRQAAATVYLAVPAVVRLVHDGEITRIGLRADGVGIDGILVDVAEIRSRLGRTDAEIVTRIEAQRLLGVEWTVLNALIRVGAIPSEASRILNRRIQVVIPREGLDRFTLRYVGLGEVSKSLGIGKRYVRTVLTERGIHPALTQEEIGVHYYERTEIEAIDRAGLPEKRQSGGKPHLRTLDD